MKPIIYLFMSFLTFTVKGQTTIDIYNGILNESIITELTVDKVTDMLGRPSAVAKNQLTSEVDKNQLRYDFGAELYYHDKGLYFHFFPKSRDSQQRIMQVLIYLVRTWDENYKEFYLPFSGNIVPNVNSNMKTKDLILLFKNDSVKVSTAEQRRISMAKDLKKARIPFDPREITSDQIWVKNKGFYFGLECEEVTKYLERVILNYTN